MSAASAGTPRRWARLVAGIAAAVVLATSGVGWAAITRYSGKINQFPFGLSRTVADGQPVTILFVASDDRAGLSHQQKKKLHLGYQDYGKHTDTMMLVHISAAGDAASVVSLPRDTLVTIPAYTSSGKTRAAHSGQAQRGVLRRRRRAHDHDCGGRHPRPDRPLRRGELRRLPHHGRRARRRRGLPAQGDHGQELRPRPARRRQTVSGPQALAYVRARYIDPTADLGRMQRQQRFVGAMAAKALRPARC